MLVTAPARRCEAAADPARAAIDEMGVAQATTGNRQGSPRFTEGRVDVKRGASRESAARRKNSWACRPTKEQWPRKKSKGTAAVSHRRSRLRTQSYLTDVATKTCLTPELFRGRLPEGKGQVPPALGRPCRHALKKPTSALKRRGVPAFSIGWHGYLAVARRFKSPNPTLKKHRIWRPRKNQPRSR